MDEIHLFLTCSDGTCWEKQVCSVTLPAVNGLLGVLRNHAPMLCALCEGTVSCRTEAGERVRIHVSDGIASVADNQVTLLLSHMRVEE